MKKNVSQKQKETEVAAPEVATSDDQNSKKTEATKDTGDKPASPAKAVKPSRRPLLVAALALLVALLSLAATGYVAWRGKPLEDNQPSLLSGQEQLQSQLARQQARLTETIQSLTPFEQELQQQQQQNTRLLNRVDNLSRHFNELAGSNRDGWKLAEVEYLLRLANQKLLMTADVTSAKALLNDADSILLELDDYTLFPVREALAEDLAGLRMVPDFDQEGLYLRLSALTAQVDDLPLLSPGGFDKNSTPVVNEATASAESNDDWQSTLVAMLKGTWSSFASLFRFNSDRTRPVAPLLTTEENLLLRQNLRLLIEQSKLALLAREQGIYAESLQQASQWVEQYFEMSGDASLGMLEELGALSAITVNPKLPNINRALDALKLHRSADPVDADKAAAADTPEEDSPEENRKGEQQ